MTTVILSPDDCTRLLRPAEVIQALESAHVDLFAGRALQPLPAAMRDPADTSPSAAAVVPMTATAGHLDRTVVKLLVDAPDNRDRGLPAQRSTVALFSTLDASCLAVADGRVLTRIRTAAATVLATRELARPDARVLGLVGAGALAVEHVRLHAELLGFTDVVVWSRSPASRERFVREVPPQVRVEGVGDVHEVFDRADVVCTLTPSPQPVVTRKVLRPGLHLAAVGSPPRPEFSELDPDVFEDVDLVVVDDPGVAIHESGNVRNALAAGTLRTSELVPLGAVLAGAAPGRRRDGDVTLFNSVGIGLQDLAVLDLLHRRALEEGVGQAVSLRD